MTEETEETHLTPVHRHSETETDTDEKTLWHWDSNTQSGPFISQLHHQDQYQLHNIYHESLYFKTTLELILKNIVDNVFYTMNMRHK